MVTIIFSITPADALSGLGAALSALAEQDIQMIYDKTYMVLADGNYGLAVSEGTFGGAHTSCYDLFRVENGKVPSKTMRGIPGMNSNIELPYSTV